MMYCNAFLPKADAARDLEFWPKFDVRRLAGSEVRGILLDLAE